MQAQLGQSEDCYTACVQSSGRVVDYPSEAVDERTARRRGSEVPPDVREACLRQCGIGRRTCIGGFCIDTDKVYAELQKWFWPLVLIGAGLIVVRYVFRPRPRREERP